MSRAAATFKGGNILKRLIAMALGMVTLLSPAFATEAQEDNTVTTSGGQASAVVELTAEATPISYTVPLGTIVREDSTVEILEDEEVPLADVPDIDLGAWYYPGVAYCVSHGLMEGYPDGSFGPDDPLTRAMVVQILHNLEGNPAVNYTMRFADVSDRDWYAAAVRWAAANGIVNGYGGDRAGQFGPDDDVTREQLVTILRRYALYKGYAADGTASSLAGYTDARMISGYALDSMRWAVGAGIVNGTSGTTLSPADGSTRAQMAAVMMRYHILFGGDDK